MQAKVYLEIESDDVKRKNLTDSLEEKGWNITSENTYEVMLNKTEEAFEFSEEDGLAHEAKKYFSKIFTAFELQGMTLNYEMEENNKYNIYFSFGLGTGKGIVELA